MGLADRYRTQAPANAGNAFTAGIEQQQAFGLKQSATRVAQMQAQRAERTARRQQELDAAIDEMYTAEGHDPMALVKLSRRYGDVMGEGMLGQVSAQEKSLHTKLAQPVYAAANNGNYALAAELAKKASATLMEYDPDEAEQYEMFAKGISDENPKVRDAALDSAGMILMEVMGVEEFETMAKALKTFSEKEGLDQEQDIKATQARKKKLAGRIADIRTLVNTGTHADALPRLNEEIASLRKEGTSEAAELATKLERVVGTIELSESSAVNAGPLMNDIVAELSPEMMEATSKREYEGALTDKTQEEASLLQPKFENEQAALQVKQDDLQLRKDEFAKANSPEAQKIQSQQLAIEKQKLEVQLETLKRGGKRTDLQTKTINDASVEARKNFSTMAKTDRLLSEIGALRGSGGTMSVMGDKFNKFLGNYDKRTVYRTKITGFINDELLKGLPPGAASQKDVEIVQSGFPPQGATEQEIKDFLKSAQQVAKDGYEYNLAKTAYLSENGGSMGNADTPIAANYGSGILEVPEGSSFDIEWEKMIKAREAKNTYTNPVDQANSDYLDAD